MEVIKEIKFQYFRVIFNKNDNKPIRYDLCNWIDKIEKLELGERRADIKGYPVRLESVNPAGKSGEFFHLQFVKMTNAFIPSTAFDNQKIEPIELDNDEYIALDVNTLYDIKSQTLMIQINRGSLSPERIKDYINETALRYKLFNAGENISLLPIYNNVDLKTIERKKYRQIELSFDCTQDYIENNTTVDAFMTALKKLGGRVGYIKIGMGRSPKDCGLINTEVDNCIDSLKSLKETEVLKKGNVVYIDDKNDSYKYDLFEQNILTDKHIFSVEPRKCLESKTVKNAMTDMLQKRLTILRR